MSSSSGTGEHRAAGELAPILSAPRALGAATPPTLASRPGEPAGDRSSSALPLAEGAGPGGFEHPVDEEPQPRQWPSSNAAGRALPEGDEHGGYLHLATGVLGERPFLEVVQRLDGDDGYGTADAPVRMAAHRGARPRPATS